MDCWRLVSQLLVVLDGLEGSDEDADDELGDEFENIEDDNDPLLLLLSCIFISCCFAFNLRLAMLDDDFLFCTSLNELFDWSPNITPANW